jgi:RNA polymerase sigma-70 factor (ECF subfamily)
MPSPTEDTGHLVRLASSGDAGAVHELLARYHGPLADYVRRHQGAGLAQKESSSDLVQSVCREVLEDLTDGSFRYRGEAEFRQWLFQVAINKIRMRGRYWNAERRDADREADAAPSCGGEPPLATETPSRVAVHQEQEQQLRAALARLPEEQRKIVEWARLEGLSHREIGERLRVTESHSRVLLARAMAQLAKIVAG